MAHSLDDAEQHDPTTPSDATRTRRDRSRTVYVPQADRGTLDGSLRQQWREEFPYHWSADELVTRRDTLRFLVAGTGALFVATATLAVIGALGGASQTHVVAVAR